MPERFTIKRMKAAAAQAQSPLTTQEYEITEPTHKPDLRGEFAGAKVYSRNGKQFVRLAPVQARFYLDQGVLQLVEPATQ